MTVEAFGSCTTVAGRLYTCVAEGCWTILSCDSPPLKVSWIISELFRRPMFPFTMAAASLRFNLMLFCLFMLLEVCFRLPGEADYFTPAMAEPWAACIAGEASCAPILYWVSSLFIF